MADDDVPTPTYSDADRDVAIRTIAGEAGNQPLLGQRAVANVMLNRAASGNYGGTTLRDVALAPSQFEAWSNPDRLFAISTDSPEYQRAATAFDAAASGQLPDPTGGAVNFINPSLQTKLGRKIPSWAQGQGQQIGDHVFYGGSSDGGKALAFTAPTGPNSPANDAIDALILGKPMPASEPKTSQSQPGVTFDTSPPPVIAGAQLPSWIVPDRLKGTAPMPSSVSDSDIDGFMSAPTQVAPIATPAQTAAGVKSPSGEFVVGGKPFTTNDGLWNGLRNFANGTLLGAGVPLSAAVAAAKEKYIEGSPLSFSNLYDQAKDAYSGARADYQDQHPIAAPLTETAGMLPTALGIGGAVSGAARSVPVVGNLLSGTAGLADATGAGGNVFTRMASQGLSGALQGGAVGAASSGLNDQPVANNLLSGGVAGGVLGSAFPAAEAATRGIGNAVLGTATNPARAALADTARNQFGIPIGGGQISSSPAVRVLDSVVNRYPGAGGTASREAQQTAFNRAVAGTMGEQADHVTPEVMASARDRIGEMFDSVAERTPFIRADQQFAQDLHAIIHDASMTLTPEELTPIRRQVGNLLDKVSQGNGGITGDTYQALTAKTAPLGRLQVSQNSNLKGVANDIRDALDGAMERSAPADAVGDLRQARSQWKSMRTIEDLVAADGTGDISPAKFANKVVQKNKGTFGAAYGGGGDQATLGQVARNFLSEPPNSNTADRGLAMNLLAGIGTSGAGMLSGEVPLSAALTGAGATVGTALAARGVGNVLRSGPYANMLIRRGLANAAPREPGIAQNLLSGFGTALPVLSGVGASEMRPAVANGLP